MVAASDALSYDRRMPTTLKEGGKGAILVADDEAARTRKPGRGAARGGYDVTASPTARRPSSA